MISEENQKPRVVLVAVENELLTADQTWLDEQGAISFAANGLMKSFPAWTTTLVTGVDPLIHDIVDSMIVEPDSFEVRSININDCRFSTIWLEGSDNDLRMSAIDWPATNLNNDQISHAITPGDIGRKIKTQTPDPADVELAQTVVTEGEHSRNVAAQREKITATLGRTRYSLKEAKNLIDSSESFDFIALSIRDLKLPEKSDLNVDAIHDVNRKLLAAFIERIPPGTICIVSEKRRRNRGESDDENPTGPRSPFIIHVFGSESSPDEETGTAIGSIAPTIRNLLGLPHPLGASHIGWPFLMDDHAKELERPLPRFFESKDVDPVDLARKAMELPNETGRDKSNRNLVINTLRRQAEERVHIAMLKLDWGHMISAAKVLTILRGSGRDYWQLFIAYERNKSNQEMKNTLEEMMQKHPNKPMTRVAEAITILPTNPDQSKAILESIDVDEIAMPLVFSGLGRTAAVLRMNSLAVNMLERVIKNGRPIPMDRIALAQTYSRLGQPEDAIRALGKIGLTKGSMEARLLRAEMHLQAKQPVEAAEVARLILKQNPADSKAKSIASRAEQAISAI